jgi:hypothetical protein
MMRASAHRIDTMTTRREFLRASTLALAAPTLTACTGSSEYDAAAAALWRHPAVPPPAGNALQRELVRCATLAANSHNTQPWRFELLPNAIVIRPDPVRRTPVVDPEDHHLWVSLGCAAENLAQAAAAYGLNANVGLAGDRVVVALEPAAATRSALFEAIVRRQCTRAEYDGQPLAAAELQQLEAAATREGVRPVLITDRARIDNVLDYVIQGNTTQLQDPRFAAELKSWVRFSDGEAIATGDGLSGRSSGSPSIPRWLGSLIFGFVFTAKSLNDQYTKQIRSSSGIVVFVSERSDPRAWVEVGRAYQRFALQATALDIRNAFVNQPVEVAALRSQFGVWLDLGGARPDLVVRVGRGPAMPPSLRRPLDAVIA